MYSYHGSSYSGLAPFGAALAFLSAAVEDSACAMTEGMGAKWLFTISAERVAAELASERVESRRNLIEL